MTFHLFRFRSGSVRNKLALALWWSALSASLGLLAVAATVLGCSWEIGTDHSVRFNPYRNEKEFGRLPPLPKYASEGERKLFSWDREVGHYSYEEAEKTAEQTDKLWDKAGQAEGDGRLGDTRRLLRQYLDRTQAQRYARWYSPKDVQKRRNAAIDKLDALAKLDRGAAESAVSAYLAARRAYDAASPPEQVLKLLEGVRSDKRLMDNAEYLEAALRQHGDERASQDFEKLAVSYPKSDKREAALFMAAVLSMKLSKSYQSESEGSPARRACDDCRDEFWRRARAGFERVMREYPRGRYYSDAQGWQGRLCLLTGDRVGAMVEYYRMLGQQEEAGRVEALFSLWLFRRNADDSEMKRVERALEREPQAALVYAYHNIYNYAFKGIYVGFSDEDPDTEREKQSHELNRITSFSTRMMNRFPAGGVGAGFVVRVAEANLELGKDAAASRLARRALGLGAKGEIRAEALWVAGAAEFRRHQYSSARQALETLIAENPDNRYTEGARRQLAMLAEDTGDIEGALDQYLALDYRYDVAYFADVR